MTALALHVRPRAALALALVSLVGVAAFTWPLLADPSSGLGHDADAPWLFAALLPLLILVVLAELSGGGVDAKSVAMLGVLSAVGAALRPLGAGVTGFQPMFLLLVLGGRVLGPGFGFVLGATTMFSSALLTGGVGPWLPFQMLGAAWMGFFAGLLPPLTGRAEVLMLAAYGAVSGVAFGFLLNLWFWPFQTGLSSSLSFVPGAPVSENLGRFLAFSLATSLGWDLLRGLGNALLVLVVGAPVLRALRRATRRAAFGAPVRFEPSTAGAAGPAGGPAASGPA
jgi:energy-coupling factor transport system substrate-specific component